jgi:hypothetical protein
MILCTGLPSADISFVLVLIAIYYADPLRGHIVRCYGIAAGRKCQRRKSLPMIRYFHFVSATRPAVYTDRGFFRIERSGSILADLVT